MNFDAYRKNWLLLAAGASASVTLGLAIADKTASATVVAGFTIALIFVHNLPLLESLKGWGVEAKLRERAVEEKLGRAEEMLARMDEISSVIGLTTLNWVLYVGMIASPDWNEKSGIIRNIRKLYKDREIPAEVAAVEQKIIQRAGWRLANAFNEVLMNRYGTTPKRLRLIGEGIDWKIIESEAALRSELYSLRDSFGAPQSDLEKIERGIALAIQSFSKILVFEEAPLDVETGVAPSLYEAMFEEKSPENLH
ncbi:hypothetical protein FV232_00945 [Methylobacterium sp. WL30]|uniref:hypothetical protein n=1 Tax=unclassified Methylobacterium TaxID=2615210 RepID=UPI0011C7086B|nr:MULTISPECIES: hypothetical protein [unclassified Methylobacterium]TXN38978.1 hypothetical protein FV225_11655 [Methylobacterium sp. WL93]TXN52265.1 hypothetical protein FV227_04225 [Methylobacterium sp. WL119]TXN70652.1 hypothetical protein FV232_00945 [Methylobacterium sp. WL30]